ncbi:unnamed protein product [Rotaria socialis]|uniref:TIR domain-containing protein n=1 Tax=Rotaria socialis TaxID=392032 RepID=A0A818F7X5_9BILA|nr:unnamed protein product [Rotaria socialis]CAF3516924.1 unnamed protein product [Rotaria socialis]CAF3565667.1 unnamed protein product [Rotaria socialis]CAF3662238.1 unnamed protein product [Rotaria socialis]CAF4116189.1 unnamed protein product [Rotaria socialis]
MTSSTNLATKYVVFSYSKNNQELVLKIYGYLKNENLPVWINVQDGTNKDIHESEDNIINNISILVCFLTPMYQTSKFFQKQVESARRKRIPIIACRLLPNWKPSGWLNKITSDLLTIDLRGINQKNFLDKTNKLREKVIWLLDNQKDSELLSILPVHESLIDIADQSILLDDSDMFSLVENFHSNCCKKKPIKYRILPKNCCLSLSNLMICNNEYILISGNNHLHLFDRNLKLIRSNNDRKINEDDLKDLSWCSYLNCFIILTKKQIYLMNSLTSKLSIIENIKLKDHREEFISCCCSEEKFYVITCQLNSSSFYFEEYNLPTFRFLRKFQILDFIENTLIIQNGVFNKNFNLEEILSLRYYDKKLAIIMKIGSNWFIYFFYLYDQPFFLKKILLEDKSRITIIDSLNQLIIFKDYLSNSFIQMPMDLENKFQTNQISNYSKAFIDFNGKLRSIASFRMSNLVLLIDNALVIYKL